MTLTFEYTMNIGAGLSPQAIHSKDNLLRIFYLTPQHTVSGLVADPVLGLYADLDFESKGRVSPDDNVSLPSIKRVAHYGGYGFWSAEGDHRFVMFMMPTDISKALIDGSVSFSIGSEVSQMSCSLINIRGELLNRFRALVTPGTMMELYFTLGSAQEVTLGIFYIDRASVSYPDEKVSVSARNAIGKLLKEQTFDEHTDFPEGALIDNMTAIMELAGVEDYFIGDSGKAWRLRFEPDVTLLDGLNRIISLLPGWKIDETQNGTVGVAAATDPRFDQPGTFTFERDKTCWSYSIEFDDSDAASKVCVTCKEPENRIYKDVPFGKWWVQPSHRTLYVEAAEGASLTELNRMAQELADSLAISGRLETFVGIFTPQLTLGDEVHIAAAGTSDELVGTVTAVTHNFGKSGFYTSFTVDSGGRKSKSRLSELIGKASAKPNTNGVEIY